MNISIRRVDPVPADVGSGFALFSTKGEWLQEYPTEEEAHEAFAELLAEEEEKLREENKYA